MAAVAKVPSRPPVADVREAHPARTTVDQAAPVRRRGAADERREAEASLRHEPRPDVEHTLRHDPRREDDAPRRLDGGSLREGTFKTKQSALAYRSPPDYSHLSKEDLMEQARHYLCWQCYTAVPSGHKFCGRCGAETPPEIMELRDRYFSEMQNPAKARVVVIRGEGLEGLAYHLKQDQHIVGRKGGIEFSDDPFVSPKHANLFYRDTQLFIRDEGSLNGVFVRIRGTVDISAGDVFLAGEQVFRLDQTPKAGDPVDPDGTAYYTSPRAPSPFRVTQLVAGGALGMTVCARTTSLALGREGADLNFPADIYMSGNHCRIDEQGGKYTLTDLGSRNGTYLRIKTERELGHGDYVFIGRKLLRVELNS